MKKTIFASCFALFSAAIIATLVMTSCVSCSSPQAQWGGSRIVTLHPNQPESTHLYLDAVGIIFTLPGKEGSSGITGTAFAIKKDLILTAGHVCEKFEEAKKEGKVGGIGIGLTGGHGLPGGWIKATILKWSMTPDLCLLSAPGHRMSVLPISQRYKSIRSGDRVLVPGAPAGYFPVIRDGRISSVFAYAHGEHNADSLLVDVVAEGGNSGSPIIWKGEVIGLLVRVPLKPRNAAIAVTSMTILEFLDGALVEDKE